jgi:hypothetical protein
VTTHVPELQHFGMYGFTRTLSLMVPSSVKGVARDKTAVSVAARAHGAGPSMLPGTRICAPAKARC